MQETRRRFIQAAAAGASALASPAIFARQSLNTANSSAQERLLIVLAATGGASIVDSFLPVLRSESNTSIRSYAASQIDSVEGSAFRTLKNLDYRLGVPVGSNYEMKSFVRNHSRDMAVLTFTGSSVNHLVAAQRSLNGNGVNRGRTLMEAVAMAYGSDKLLPNVNMAFGGYALDGTDVSLPRFAKAEKVADALLFPLELHREQVITGRANHDLLEAARGIRSQLEELQPHAATLKSMAPLREYLNFRQRIPEIEEAQLLESLSLIDLARFGEGQHGFKDKNSLLKKVREAFPLFLSDPLEAQAAMAFLLLRYGVSCSVTIGLDSLVRFQGVGQNRIMSNLPLGFDWSHNAHQGAQNSMWRRLLSILDRLLLLLKSEDHLGQAENGKMWDRSFVHIATEFGRDRGKNKGSGHDLNNGVLMISPLLQGNRVYGGVNQETGLTFGCNLATGEPQMDKQNSEAEVHQVILQALGISTPGQPNVSGLIKKA